MACTKRYVLALAAPLFLTSACSLFGFEGVVTGETAPPVLLIHNETNRTVYYFAGDEADLALVDLDLSDYDDWPTVAAGQTARVPYEDLWFYDEGDTRAWVYWTTGRHSGSFRVSLE